MTEEREQYTVETDEPGTISFASELMQRWPRGFIRIPLGIVLDTSLSAEAKLIAGILAWFGWDKDQVWPGMETLGKWMARHRHTVAPWVKELVDQGWVTRKRQGLPARWHYTLHYERGIVQQVADHPQRQVGHTDTPTGGKGRGGPEREPSNENQKNESNNNKGLTHSLTSQFWTLYQKYIGLSYDDRIASEANELVDALETLAGPLVAYEWIEQAFTEMLSANARNWNYLRKVLNTARETQAPPGKPPQRREYGKAPANSFRDTTEGVYQ